MQTSNDNIPLSWIVSDDLDLNAVHGQETLHFTPSEHKLPAVHIAQDGSVCPETREVFVAICKEVKSMCTCKVTDL